MDLGLEESHSGGDCRIGVGKVWSAEGHSEWRPGQYMSSRGMARLTRTCCLKVPFDVDIGELRRMGAAPCILQVVLLRLPPGAESLLHSSLHLKLTAAISYKLCQCSCSRFSFNPPILNPFPFEILFMSSQVFWLTSICDLIGHFQACCDGYCLVNLMGWEILRFVRHATLSHVCECISTEDRHSLLAHSDCGVLPCWPGS